jgi:histidine triad (HIT) family protein
MFNHAPANYTCPICLGVQGIENEHTLLKRDDLVYQDEKVSAFINSFWIGKNEGHVIIVPNKHFENIYNLPPDLGHQIFDIAQRISLALKKTYHCDGITLRQNNEPAGDQHAFHYHLHVFPRYKDDDFNLKLAEKSRLSDPEERLKYASKLKDYLEPG